MKQRLKKTLTILISIICYPFAVVFKFFAFFYDSSASKNNGCASVIAVFFLLFALLTFGYLQLSEVLGRTFAIIIYFAVFFVIFLLSFILSQISKSKSLRKALTCPHGVYKGKEETDGKMKCQLCQQEYEENLHKFEERRALEYMKEERKRHYNESQKAALERYKDSIYSNEQIIMKMNAYEFEEYTAKLFERMGCKNVRLTPKSNDGGKDFTFTIGNELYYGECKHYQRTASVGRPMIQKLSGAMTAGHAKGGVFVTTGRYTKEALQEAPRLNICTIDGTELFDLVSRYSAGDDKLDHYDLICAECSETVSFDFFDKTTTYLLCPNGHKVVSAFQYQKEVMQKPKLSRTYSKY